MGMVVRDWNGKFVAARAIGRQHLTDPLVVEATVARDGHLFARELGLDAILVEGDSQHLVQLVQRRKEDHQGARVIVADIFQF
ncbi:hypothetical protein RHMOL_Rhmol01G0046200 [Rhododendron molle]|uniref:Uncharacterized protein n=5 Tax=Rhododendron molle TaxID=49168 RepID=A0ACC0PYN4_RHOML|nr:hypothetical protein RHMOL_Rhmol01G0045400 [Rhododendron molle]KAI8570574.1 hypothetical protein RHMOL_Rhmol01G0045500 [Rhododendron molle]KAI8570575.1 hypothetical protein RHMOL_Rhmol01G0045600 [Rhododendron molle]KAI8570580.1 hypothetical protein RHMOL_Rhmol01G0046100 [Rhododendron molle]KAI8570581.1 hypothetical protein RHMOL_Rhmol01G0046200 [Rhododendron molle]